MSKIVPDFFLVRETNRETNYKRSPGYIAVETVWSNQSSDTPLAYQKEKLFRTVKKSRILGNRSLKEKSNVIV